MLQEVAKAHMLFGNETKSALQTNIPILLRRSTEFCVLCVIQQSKAQEEEMRERDKLAILERRTCGELAMKKENLNLEIQNSSRKITKLENAMTRILEAQRHLWKGSCSVLSDTSILDLLVSEYTKLSKQLSGRALEI